MQNNSSNLWNSIERPGCVWFHALNHSKIVLKFWGGSAVRSFTWRLFTFGMGKFIPVQQHFY